ncbi:type II toxin-antitoxin system PemK/MazF family toxin [Microtetraspora sp. NBRC 16547]|uniref:type II toxin-antitoxin system PemK/MazF family toxin n=1 Tax=Microtetraspora sp. NBRC 16547 TaxID=3030993 RepID=UPI0025550AEC|nr:type II toxin-antitoxin system PemK/MazF family toxin [Microtetraspora sp. NBRC 16547]
MRDLPPTFVALAALLAAALAVARATITKRRGRERPSARPGTGRGAAAPPRRPGARPTTRRTGVPAPERRSGQPSGERRPGGQRPSGLPPRQDAGAAGAAQRPGEIWWADVPFEDGPGSKIRPCVVLRTHRDGADVLKITSQDQRHRSDHIEIPTRTWDHNADHNSFLDLSDPIRVATAAFQDRAGDLDPAIWRHVCSLHGIAR